MLETFGLEQSAWLAYHGFMPMDTVATLPPSMDSATELIIDLRDEIEQLAEPLSNYLQHDVLTWSLLAIEQGNLPPIQHSQKVMLVCEYGHQSQLACMYLHADGYGQVQHLAGGIRTLRQMEKRFSCVAPITESRLATLHKHSGIRQIRSSAQGLEIVGTVAQHTLAELLGIDRHHLSEQV